MRCTAVESESFRLKCRLIARFDGLAVALNRAAKSAASASTQVIAGCVMIAHRASAVARRAAPDGSLVCRSQLGRQFAR